MWRGGAWGVLQEIIFGGLNRGCRCRQWNGLDWGGGSWWRWQVEMALLEAEQVLMAVLRLEEGAGQVVKKVPPSSSL